MLPPRARSTNTTGELEDDAPKPMTQSNQSGSTAEANVVRTFLLINAESSFSDPPPPYRDRRSRTLPRRSRRSTDLHECRSSNDNEFYDEGALAASEASPLLGYRRRERAISHSSTARSTQSFAHNVISLFQADVSSQEIERMTFWSRTMRYFKPMTHRPYYAALLHLLVINFPFALAAWIYLFVATFVGSSASLVKLSEVGSRLGLLCC